MPAAAWLAPAPIAPRSNTVTEAPRAASRQAIPRPTTPAPMIATFNLAVTDKRRLPSLELPRQVQWVCSQRVAAHPRPYQPMMGVLARLDKPLKGMLSTAAELSKLSRSPIVAKAALLRAHTSALRACGLVERSPQPAR